MNNIENLLSDGLKMVELEERLEMVQLSLTAASSCCFDSNSDDTAQAEVNAVKIEA